MFFIEEHQTLILDKFPQYRRMRPLVVFELFSKNYNSTRKPMKFFKETKMQLFAIVIVLSLVSLSPKKRGGKFLIFLK